MEVVLPFDLPNEFISPIIEGEMGISVAIHHNSNMYQDYGHICVTRCLSNKTEKICKYYGNDEWVCYEYIQDAPSKAIYTTSITEHDKRTQHYIERDSYSGFGDLSVYYHTNGHDSCPRYYPDQNNRLPTIKMDKSPFAMLPKSEYCVIQHKGQYDAFCLEEYPSDFSKLADFLNEPDHINSIPRYILIRRQVLLIQAVGNKNIKTKEFQELLLVDCDVLYEAVIKILSDFDTRIYRCEFPDRPQLLLLLHSYLVN